MGSELEAEMETGDREEETEKRRDRALASALEFVLKTRFLCAAALAEGCPGESVPVPAELWRTHLLPAVSASEVCTPALSATPPPVPSPPGKVVQLTLRDLSPGKLRHSVCWPHRQM